MQNKKILAVVIFVLISVAGAGAGFLANRFAKRPSIDPAVAARMAEEAETARLKTVKEAMSRYSARDTAASKKDPELCRKLGKEFSDSCILNIAIKNKDNKYCAEISEAKAKDECLQLFVKRDVLTGSDIYKCQEVTEPTMHQACLLEFFNRFNATGECAAFVGDDGVLCLNIVNNRLAVQKSDGKMCAEIKDGTMRKNCVESVALMPLDSDHDGTSDDVERSYGTDPFKPDIVIPVKK